MNFELNGKVALVTAVTSGIGLATARGLARQGAHVRLNGRPRPRLDAAAASIQDLIPGAALDTVVGDVSTVEALAAITEAVADVGAGRTDPLSSFVDLTEADWQFLWGYNVMCDSRVTVLHCSGRRGPREQAPSRSSRHACTAEP